MRNLVCDGQMWFQSRNSCSLRYGKTLPATIRKAHTKLCTMPEPVDIIQIRIIAPAAD